MSNTKKKRERHGGREPAVPKTPRGRAILAQITAQGLTITTAAEKARVPFRSLYNAIHGDPATIPVKTVAALCGPRLGLSLSLVAPQIADALSA